MRKQINLIHFVIRLLHNNMWKGEALHHRLQTADTRIKGKPTSIHITYKFWLKKKMSFVLTSGHHVSIFTTLLGQELKNRCNPCSLVESGNKSFKILNILWK